MSKKLTIITTVVPTVDTAGAYATGESIGGKLTFHTPPTFFQNARIRGVTIGDAAKQNSDLDIYFFEDNPSATTFTDQSTLDIDDADLPKIRHVVNLTAYDDTNDNSVTGNVALDVPYDKTKTLYVAVVSRGTPTYVAATDLDVTVTVEFS